MAAVGSAMACSPPSPSSWVLQAREAHARAVEAEADRYSPDSLALASRALDEALAEVERQSEKPPWFRDYARARALLGQARQLSAGARYEARARRDQLEMAVATMLEEASHDLAEPQSDAPVHAGGGVSDWSAWIRRFRAASDGLAEARVAFRDGDYFEAHAHAHRVVEQLRELESVSPSS